MSTYNPNVITGAGYSLIGGNPYANQNGFQHPLQQYTNDPRTGFQSISPDWQKFESQYNTVGNFLNQQAQSNPGGYAAFSKNPFALPGNLNNYSLPAAKANVATLQTQAAPVTAAAATSSSRNVTTPFKTRTTGAGTPFPSVDPNIYLNELQQTFGNLDTIFDPTQIQKAYQNQIDMTTAMGLQTANTAANEAEARSFQSGNMQNSNLIRAQALLPVYQQTSGLNTELQNQLADFSKAKATTAAQVASTLGQLRNQYTSSLADYTSRLTGIQATSRSEQDKLDEMRREFDVNSKSEALKMAQQQAQFNAGHQLDVSKLRLAQLQSQAQQIENTPYSNDYDPNSYGNRFGTNQNDWRYSSSARSQLLQQLLGANVI